MEEISIWEFNKSKKYFMGINKNLGKVGRGKAILWDRDGVLNHVLAFRPFDGEKNVGPQKFEDFKLVAGAAEVLNELKMRGWLNIVHTNQPDVARKKMSWEELMRMNDFLKTNIPAIDAIYVCPHDKADNCNCRKPKPGLLLDAAKDYHLDLAECYTVGDSGKDMEAGIAAGTKNIFIRTEYNKDYKYPAADKNFKKPAFYEAKSLKEILEIVK